jgi:kumamolisin
MTTQHRSARNSCHPVSHALLEGSARTPQSGSRAVSPVNPHAIIDLTLKLRRRRPLPELTTRPAAQMTRDQLAADFGASAADLQTVAESLKNRGLQITSANPLTRTVRVSGPAAAVERAFLVKLFNYAHATGNYRGRVGHIHVPAELHGIVQGVFGLDTRRVARRARRPAQNSGHHRRITSSCYLPAQLAAHYNFPPGDGGGQCVAILEFGGGYFTGDLQQFCQLAGISMPEVTPVSVDGSSTSARDGAEGEVMLDIEVVAGVCPKSSIAVYFAQWTEQGWIAAVDAAVHDAANSPGVISISWGAPEDTDIWTPQAMSQINETLMEAAHLGITVCVAAGDDGSSDADPDGRAHLDFPASSPYVLSIGGTTITQIAQLKPDIGWFEGDGLREHDGGSGGGGVSAVFPRPQWQSAVSISSVNPGAIAGRVIPDLSANADWNASPYLLVVDGQPQPNGGTSAATPLLAALLTLINARRAAGQRVGYLTPLLYESQYGDGRTLGVVACTDVVTGNNKTAHAGGYSAEIGYDADSGWGTPNGAGLLAALEQMI